MDPSERTPSQWIRPAADLLRAHDTEGWFYGDSIGFEAHFAASDLLKDPTYAAYAHGFFRVWRTRAEPFQELENTAPGHAMCLAYAWTGDGLVLDGAMRLARWLRSRRSLDGVYVSRERIPLRPPAGVARMEPIDAALLRCGCAGVFADCLHLGPPFFAHLGHLIGDAELIDVGVDQALGYGRLLQDESTGLFWHFHLEGPGALTDG